MRSVLGLHLLGDLVDCNRHDPALLGNAAWLESIVVRAVADAHLRIIHSSFHSSPAAGVSGCLLLAESHVVIHTWPDAAFASLDVCVCDPANDHRIAARQVFAAIAGELQRHPALPVEVVRGGVATGRLPASGGTPL